VRQIVLLDAGPLGMLGLPGHSGPGGECRRWLEELKASGALILVPDIAIYEVRRELKRRGAAAQIARLAVALLGVERVDVSADAWERAEDFWADLRKGRVPTAPDLALDGDAILAGVAASVGGAEERVVIATTNVRHLARFEGIVAREWRSIR
jgi:predicted nucleic acid-binding protein